MTMPFIQPFVLLLLSLVWIRTDGNNKISRSISTTPPKDEDCELLQSAKLVYEQHLAPRAISDVLRVVVEKINREMDGVTNVQITWDGSTLRQQHGVGLHHVQTLVERSTTSQQQCFVVPMEILDTDECTLPPSHEWYHKCHSSSAVCINTIGSYECLCPLLNPEHQSIIMEKFQTNFKNNIIGATQQHDWDDFISHPFGNRSLWEINLPISSDSKTTTANKCHGEASTKFCCDSDAHSVQGRICRSTFICPIDPCSSSSSPSCDAKLATCTRSIHPWDTPNFICTCPEGYIGNGHTCPPSTTSGDEDHYYLCGCKPIQVDLCAHVPCKEYKHQECAVVKNKPTCVCKKGYTKHHPNKGDCVPEHLPTLRVKCCNNNLVEDCTANNIPTVYYQGDYYQECGVDIINTNSDVEQDYRSLIIDYSNLHRAGSTTTQCFTQVGNYSVTYKYQLATPYDDNNPDNNNNGIISIVRTVQVQDVDECAAVGSTNDVLRIRGGGGGCPAVFVAHCDFHAGATCVNTIGSYTCKCPAYTVGDGFQKITDYDIADNGSTGPFFRPPTGFQGGTGCVDTTKPILQLLGPNPKLFRVAKIEPIATAAANVRVEHDPLLYNNIVDAQRLIRSTYGSQIQSIIDATNGAELCRTDESSKNSKCVYAFDKTYNDTFDLSSKVVIGNLVWIDDDDETNFRWKVPYNVMDAAGNEADTVYRDVIVEEVELISLIEKQEQDERERERLAAADVEIIKMKKEVKILSDKLAASQKQQQQQKKQCPKCEPPTTVTGSSSCDCHKICDTIHKNNVKLSGDTSCIPPPNTPSLSNSMIRTMIQILENGFSSSVNQIPAFVGAVVFSLGVCVLLFLRSVWVFVADKRANRRNRWNKVLEQEELALLENSVTYYKSPPLRPEAANWSAAPSDGSVLSPPPRATRLFSSDAANLTIPPLISNPDDIYASLSPITPSRNKSSGIS